MDVEGNCTDRRRMSNRVERQEGCQNSVQWRLESYLQFWELDGNAWGNYWELLMLSFGEKCSPNYPQSARDRILQSQDSRARDQQGLNNNVGVGPVNAGRGDHLFDFDQHPHVPTLVLISYREELKTAFYPLYHITGGWRSRCTQSPHPAPRPSCPIHEKAVVHPCNIPRALDRLLCPFRQPCGMKVPGRIKSPIFHILVRGFEGVIFQI